MKYCLLCKKVSKKNLLCDKCIKNPFLVEDARDILATKSGLHTFKKTYSLNYTEIKNINSEKFWNENFSTPLNFDQQNQMTKEKINKVISFLPINKPKILDIGIGQGYLEERLKQLNLSYELFGIDISSVAIKKAKASFNGNFVVGNASDINLIYQRNFFDVVIALELLEHVSPTEIFFLLEKIRFVLKKNGLFIFTCPINEGLRHKKDNPSGHVRDYTIPILNAEMKVSGFKVDNIAVFYAFEKFYVLKKFFAKIFPKRWKPNNILIKTIKI